MSEADTLARTLFGEARGEGQQGMIAVACVIMNRCHIAQKYVIAHGKPHPLFGDGTPESCCWADEQFSCWNEDDPNEEVIENVTASDPVFAAALQIAARAVSGHLNDITHGATYYYSKSLRKPPCWARGKSPCALIGNHLFFNNV